MDAADMWAFLYFGVWDKPFIQQVIWCDGEADSSGFGLLTNRKQAGRRGRMQYRKNATFYVKMLHK